MLSGVEDSNLRPHGPKPRALPTELTPALHYFTLISGNYPPLSRILNLPIIEAEPRWWNGRHKGLKSPRPQGRESSTLSRGTKAVDLPLFTLLFLF